MTACVAVWSSGPCSECAHLLPCHVEGGCHIEGCGCAGYSAIVCGIETIGNPAGECVEWDGDYGCREIAALHCAAEDPYTLHLCHADMVHHTFLAPLAHATAPKWEHRIALPPVTPSRPPLVIKPITARAEMQLPAPVTDGGTTP